MEMECDAEISAYCEHVVSEVREFYPAEFELLSLLVSHAGNVVTRAEIFDKVWGTDWLGDMRTLDVHIRWLREKIQFYPNCPQRIITIRGVGYRMERVRPVV